MATIKPDFENNAEEWWAAARAAATGPTLHEEIFRKLDGIAGKHGNDGVYLVDWEVAFFEAWASQFPGYNDGPAYAPHPFLVYQDEQE